MRVFQAFLPIFFISLFINNSVIAAEKITMDVATTHTIDSSILKEQRRLLIHLPENYETSDKTYPVVYALDGSGHIHHAAVATYMLSRYERIPETIVVAITNNRETRSRDLGDERENFKRFIKEEVISFVNKNYRTSESKTLFGHSRAGFFTLDVLATEPDMFDYYIAASPAINNEIWVMIFFMTLIFIRLNNLFILFVIY